MCVYIYIYIYIFIFLQLSRYQLSSLGGMGAFFSKARLFVWRIFFCQWLLYLCNKGSVAVKSLIVVGGGQTSLTTREYTCKLSWISSLWAASRKLFLFTNEDSSLLLQDHCNPTGIWHKGEPCLSDFHSRSEPSCLVEWVHIKWASGTTSFRNR